MKYLLPLVLGVVLGFSAVGAEPNRQTEFFARAVPSVEGFSKRLIKDGKPEPWENLGVRSLLDNVYLLAFADRWKADAETKVPLDLTIPLLKLAEEMQNKDPESRTFGNLRWYWRTPEVTDQNAVEFIAAHALPVWFECRDRLPEEARTILERILRRAVDGCIKHRVSSDYTNIAIFNAVNLILLGETFERPDAVELGKERLRAVLACFWDHGVYEYVSPTYYAPDVDTLQLGFRYVKDETLKETFRNLLDFFWTDMAMNWFKPSLRMSGAQSRTYHYLLGVSDTSRLFDFVGLAPKNPKANSATYLNSFNAAYAPSKEILALTEKYPRRITQRWGAEPMQWRTTYILDDIALGTAGAAYGKVKQNMVLTVDLADFDEVPTEDVKPLPRNYFISDGREDPYGTNRYPTSSAGHEKALHMDQVWIGAQGSVDAVGVALYPAWTLNEEIMTNVQSHFVFRKPDAIYLDGQKVVLEAKVALPIDGKTLVLRYGSRAIGIKIPWTRDKNGASPVPYLIDDANKHGVCRLSVDHWDGGTAGQVGASAPTDNPRDGRSAPDLAGAKQENNSPSPKTASRVSPKDLGDAPGIALWVRVGSHLDSEAKFEAWSKEFSNAKVDKLDVQKDDVSLHVAGIGGPVKIDGKNLSNSSAVIEVEPAGPTGILMLDGQDLGRPILEKIPFVGEFAKRIHDLKPIDVDSKGTEWEAENGFCLLDNLTEPDADASGGKAVRINGEFYWPLNVKEVGTYYLWARVHALDPEHDSFRIEWTSQSGDKQRGGGDWHLGQGKTWRWIPLKLNNEKTVTPLELTPGPWKLTLRSREMDGRVDKFFLTTDPSANISRNGAGTPAQ